MKQLISKLKTTSTKLIYVIPLRIAVGLILLHSGFDKVSSNEFTLTTLKKSISSWYIFIPWDFYKHFLDQLVFPYLKFVFYALMFGEIFAGVSILLGFRARIGGFIALVISINYYLMLSWQSSITAGFYLLLVASSLSICLMNPGNLFGLDSLLSKK